MCTILHPQLQCSKLPIHQYPHQMKLIILLSFTHPNSCVLVCHCGFNLIFPVNDELSIFICIFTICLFSFTKCLFRSFAHFLNWNYCHYYWVVGVDDVFWIQVLYQINVSQIFSVSLYSIWRKNIFNFYKVSNGYNISVLVLFFLFLVCFREFFGRK